MASVSPQPPPYTEVRTPPPLKVIRVARGLTQRQLADRAGVSPETVLRHEQRRHEPTRATAHALAAALDWPEAELFPLNDQRPAGSRALVTTPAGDGGGYGAG